MVHAGASQAEVKLAPGSRIPGRREAAAGTMQDPCSIQAGSIVLTQVKTVLTLVKQMLPRDNLFYHRLKAAK